MDYEACHNAFKGNEELCEAVLKFSDISYFLPILYFEVLMRGETTSIENVVELGSREGESSVALFSAICELNRCYGYNGVFTSVDIDAACEEALKERLGRVGERGCWRHIVGDSIEVRWTEPIDFLLIDTSHEEEQTRKELEKWSPFIKPSGTIWLHDTKSTEGVRRAALAWLEKQGAGWEWFEAPTYAGLVWLRRL